MLREEALEETIDPMAECFLFVFASKCFFRQKQNLVSRCSEAEEMVEEEIIEFIGPHQVFGQLGDISSLVRRSELRTDRGIGYIE